MFKEKAIMKKFTKILAAATAVLLTLGVAGCDKSSGGEPVIYPPFMNSEESGGGEQVSEKYVVNVLSEGGLKLDGVQVSLKRGDTELRRGISRGGKIEFGVGLGDYELVIDEASLPAGYSLPEGATYRTNPQRRDEINIRLPSKLLSASSPVKSYAPGNIMRDFTFTDVDGKNHTLSSLLQTKKAVVLNFFYCDCSACNAEFPYLQTAYANRAANANDIEVLGICTTSMRDTRTDVANKKLEFKLTFPVGLDNIGLCQAFGVSLYPTTVIIDRYGLIAARETGGQPSTSYWTQLFNSFASSNYVQNITTEGGGGNNGGNSGGELMKPEVAMPSSVELAQAALSERVTATFTADKDEYAWPWIAGSDADGDYICASNSSKTLNKSTDNSYAAVHAKITMEANQLLSFEYFVSSETNADYLYFILDGAQMNTGYSGGDGKWHEVNLYVSDRKKTVDLAFVYIKDAGDPETGTGEDIAKIRNISVVDATAATVTTPLDVMRDCASGSTVGNKYEHYVNAVVDEKGFYHKDSVNGPLIYMTINQLTPWSELHGSTMTGKDGTEYPSTIFRITADKYLEVDDDEESENNVSVVIGNEDYAEAYTQYVLIMNYMPAPYYLIPVTTQLKEWAEAVAKDVALGSGEANEWLEFCYYYDHYGPEHVDGETCNVNVDYTRGLTRYNAYTAYEKSDLEKFANGEITLADDTTYNEDTGRNVAQINFPLQLAHNGAYYEFKADEAGVYQIRSYTRGCSPSVNSTADNTDLFVTADPKILIYDQNGGYISMSDDVLDFDAFTDEETYEGFNTYLKLDKGQTVYLYLATTSATRSYYDFEITYKGESYEKMMICSTGGGAWTWIDRPNGQIYTYIGIDYATAEVYNEDTHQMETRYFAQGENGQPDLDQPIYIDFIYSSFFISSIQGYNYQTLEYMIRDNGFAKYVHDGIEYEQPTMTRYLGEALSKSPDDKTYGLIPANQELVNIINALIDRNADGAGEGNGWLMFAVYNAKLG